MKGDGVYYGIAVDILHDDVYASYFVREFNLTSEKVSQRSYCEITSFEIAKIVLAN